MKIFAVRQLVSRGMGGLVMVLVDYGSNDNKLQMEGSGEWMVCHFDREDLHLRHLLAVTSLLCLSEQYAVIVSASIASNSMLQGIKERLK